jgi:hypothetical protein
MRTASSTYRWTTSCLASQPDEKALYASFSEGFALFAGDSFTTANVTADESARTKTM